MKPVFQIATTKSQAFMKTSHKTCKIDRSIFLMIEILSCQTANPVGFSMLEKML